MKQDFMQSTYYEQCKKEARLHLNEEMAMADPKLSGSVATPTDMSSSRFSTFSIGSDKNKVNFEVTKEWQDEQTKLPMFTIRATGNIPAGVSAFDMLANFIKGKSV